MSKRYINDTFWTDAYIEKLTPDEKLLFIYLLTNPLNNIAGMYEIRSKRIGFETGYDIEVVENILKRFEKDKKILRNEDFIVIVNHIKNQALNPSVIQGCVRIIEGLSESNRQAVTGWVQSGTLYLTLLNLTLPNAKKAEDTFSLTVDEELNIKEEFENLRVEYRKRLNNKCGGFETEYKNAKRKLNLTSELLGKMKIGATRMLSEFNKKKEEWEKTDRTKPNPFTFVVGFQVFINQKRWEHYLSEEEIKK